jgi:hypothetical protein
MDSAEINPSNEFDSMPTSPQSLPLAWTGEVIAGYPIHPYASQWPLIEGKLFEDLVTSIEEFGIDVPIEMSEGLVTDGRNRLRAVEVLRSRGVDVRVPIVEWQASGGYGIEMHIFVRNGLRRNMTVDQLVVLAIPFLGKIRLRVAERQAASRFTPGTANDAEAETAAEKSPPPADELPKPPRSSSEKDAASTVGQFAKLANISNYKAAQGVKLADGVEAGDIAPEELDHVLSRRKRIRDVLPDSRRKRNPATPPRSKTTVSRAPADTFFDDSEIAEEAPIPSEAEARRRWERAAIDFAIADLPEWRRLFIKVIGDDQKRHDR